MTDRERLEEKAEDIYLALLMNDVMEEEGAFYLAENERLENDPDAAVPEDVDRRALQLIEREYAKRKRAKTGGKALRVVGRFLIAAAITALLFGAAYALSPAVRAGTLNFLMQIDTRMTAWQFYDNAGHQPGNSIEAEGSLDILVDWMPEGYKRQPIVITGPTDRVLDITNEQGDMIRISVHPSEDFIHTLDMEDAEYSSTVTVQGCEGVLISKDGIIRLDWVDPVTSLVICVESEDVDIDTIFRIAQGVHIIG